VQAIKRPELLEIQGPMFMSAPVLSHVQYRLTAEGGKTRVRLVHRAMGLIPPEISDGEAVGGGWSKVISRVREAAERAAKEKK
jgi:hypothetical protein